MECEMRTYIGTRNEQQDYAKFVTDDKGLFAVVCDGMGGRDGGQLASRTAVNEITQMYLESYEEHFQNFLINTAQYLDEKISHLSTRKSGTTIVSVYINKQNEIFWLSVGDSRLYIVRDGKMKQVTNDHNYYYVLNKLRQSGKLSDEAYEDKKGRGKALISFLGMNGLGVIDVSAKPVKLEKNDRVFLCTDGFYNCADMKLSADIISSEGSASHITELLIEMVKASSKNHIDNTTLILIKNLEEI